MFYSFVIFHFSLILTCSS